MAGTENNQVASYIQLALVAWRRRRVGTRPKHPLPLSGSRHPYKSGVWQTADAQYTTNMQTHLTHASPGTQHTSNTTHESKYDPQGCTQHTAPHHHTPYRSHTTPSLNAAHTTRAHTSRLLIPAPARPSSNASSTVPSAKKRTTVTTLRLLTPPPPPLHAGPPAPAGDTLLARSGSARRLFRAELRAARE